MSNKSLLATVHAAAHGAAIVPAADAVITSQTEGNSMANPKSLPADAVLTVVDLRAAFPDLCAAIHAEGLAAGATAERARVLGIASLADGSNAALIAELQADGKTTPGDAALRVLGAQKLARGQQLQAIVDVDKVTSGINPAPTSAAAPDAPAVVKHPATPEGWKAQWAADEKLQAEFESAEAFAAYQNGVASGRIKRLESRASV